MASESINLSYKIAKMLIDSFAGSSFDDLAGPHYQGQRKCSIIFWIEK